MIKDGDTVPVVSESQPSLVTPSPVKTEAPGTAELDRTEELRAEVLRREIQKKYNDLPKLIRYDPKARERCLGYLLDAENELGSLPSRKGNIKAQQNLARVEIEFTQVGNQNVSFIGVVGAIIIFIGVSFLPASRGFLALNEDAAKLNQHLLMGIPLPVIAWSVIGSLTSMLLRAGQLPFSRIHEALRWLFFRPIVGTVMGVLTYLMVIAGLIVFTGTSNTTTPQLFWVIAFVGSFSDTLSVNLLRKIAGGVAPTETSGEAGTPTGDTTRTPSRFSPPS